MRNLKLVEHLFSVSISINFSYITDYNYNSLTDEISIVWKDNQVLISIK